MTLKPKKKTKKSTIHWPSVVLMISIVALLIPTVAVGMVLLDAFESTGKPLYGNRFATEINNELTSDQIEEIQTVVSEQPSVRQATVNLRSATLRVNVLVNNEIDEEQVSEITANTMNQIFNIAPREAYFQMASMYKQYDLELHVYNDRTMVDDDDYIYVIMHINSVMEEPLIQLVSKPKNPDFVAILYERLFGDDSDDDTDEDDE